MRPAILAVLICGSAAVSAETVTVSPKVIDDVLANPFKGFAPYADTFYANPVIPQSLVYADVTWAALEPEREKIDWNALEKNWAQHLKLGRRIGFRFKLADPWIGGEVDIPEWLAKSGVPLRPYEIDGGKGQAPDWDDETLLIEHARILAALGQRYNNDPRIAWIDVGSYGFWGEWHVWKNEKLAAKNESKQRILDAYLKAFPGKRMVIPFDDDFALKYMSERGCGVRNDNLGRPDENKWYLTSVAQVSKAFADEQFKRAIITGEFGNSEKGAVEGTTKRFAQNLEFIKATHWSFVGPAGGSLLNPKNGEHRRNCEALYKALGYRFAVLTLSHEKTVKAGAALSLSLTLRNDGCAPFYYPWPVEISLVDAAGKVAFAARPGGEWDVQKWLPGERALKTTLELPKSLAPGGYSLCLAILDPGTAMPGVRFANEGRDDGGRYRFSRILIEKP